MRDDDLATAQSIIDAAGITVPTGDLCQGCYDEQGALYRLPQCVVSDPENMVQADHADEYSDEDDDDMSKLTGDDASGDELISDDLEKRRDEKGKTSERDLISVRARLSDRGGLDLVVSVGKNRSVGFIARKIRQEADVCLPNPSYRPLDWQVGLTLLFAIVQIDRQQIVRIAYLGKVLKGHSSLPDQGWQPGHVINAFITPRPST